MFATEIIRLLLRLFTTRIVPVIHGIPFKEQHISPSSRVRHGCPFGFAMLVLPLALKVVVSPAVTTLLLIIISPPPMEAMQVVMFFFLQKQRF